MHEVRQGRRPQPMARRAGGRVVAVCLTLCLACTRGSPSAGAPASGGGPRAEGARATAVTVAEVTRGPLSQSVQSIGHAAPVQSVVVRPRVEGRLDRVCFAEGQAVQRGELLAEIDLRPYRIARAQAQAALTRDRASLKNAELNLSRLETLRHKDMVSEQQATDQAAMVFGARATVAADEAQLANAELQLEYARIEAPIAGITGLRGIDAGNLVRPGDGNSLVVIHQVDPIAILFSVPQRWLGDIFRAQESSAASGGPVVQVVSPGSGTPLGQARLVLVDNEVQAQTGTIRCKALLPNGERTLWPNQFVHVGLELSRREHVLSVPEASVREEKGEAWVMAAVDGHAKRIAVRVQARVGGRAAVEGALPEGTKVITDGVALVSDGDAVRTQVAAPDGFGAAP